MEIGSRLAPEAESILFVVLFAVGLGFRSDVN